MSKGDRDPIYVFISPGGAGSFKDLAEQLGNNESYALADDRLPGCDGTGPTAEVQYLSIEQLAERYFQQLDNLIGNKTTGPEYPLRFVTFSSTYPLYVEIMRICVKNGYSREALNKIQCVSMDPVPFRAYDKMQPVDAAGLFLDTIKNSIQEYKRAIPRTKFELVTDHTIQDSLYNLDIPGQLDFLKSSLENIIQQTFGEEKDHVKVLRDAISVQLNHLLAIYHWFNLNEKFSREDSFIFDNTHMIVAEETQSAFRQYIEQNHDSLGWPGPGSMKRIDLVTHNRLLQECIFDIVDFAMQIPLIGQQLTRSGTHGKVVRELSAASRSPSPRSIPQISEYEATGDVFSSTYSAPLEGVSYPSRKSTSASHHYAPVPYRPAASLDFLLCNYHERVEQDQQDLFNQTAKPSSAANSDQLRKSGSQEMTIF